MAPYSLRIFVDNTNIGANGKGKTPLAALCSAYAELIERIQTSTPLSIKNSKFFVAPDEKLIPAEHSQTITVNCDEMIDSIERVSLLINDSFSIPVRCAFSKEELLISCSTALGRAKEKMNIDLKGEEFEMGLNSRYLLEALRACECDKVTFNFNGATAGVTITPAEPNEQNMLYLIMPMRLK